MLPRLEGLFGYVQFDQYLLATPSDFDPQRMTILRSPVSQALLPGKFLKVRIQRSTLESRSFLVLSALLAEITSDPQYLQAANKSANFIHSHLYNLRNIVQNSISTDIRDNCTVQPSTDPSSSGVMVEGLSILSSITNNGSTQEILSDLIEAIIPDPRWHNDNGIVTAQGTQFHRVNLFCFSSRLLLQGIDGGLRLLRGLNAFYMRNQTNTALRRYVAHYMAVQFNAVTNLATANNTNIYGGSWTGPPSANFSATNQTLALGALINAIGLETFSSSSPSSSPSPTSSLRKPKPRKTAAILGGTLGGLGILVLILIFLWCLRRRLPRDSSTANVVPEPFLTPHTARSLAREKRGNHRNPPLSSAPIMPANIQTALDHDVENAPASVLPTEQLVQLLNQRLQNRRWAEGELPPDYPATW
ncbi:Glycoside hydrolase family 76 protein [Mycena venus]|uniref:Glycoside hydrolase family 76 protein n=1 Tax=Mycena venus TaxID=2733690 RepID=A0A8H7CD68_9AGAR|nr:Glycoside hydrolase family 76 protein [Mycena venus]